MQPLKATTKERITDSVAGWFLTQSIVVYVIGIKMFLSLVGNNSSQAGAVTACFAACVPLTAIMAEVFYRLIEVPSHGLSHAMFDWIRE